MNPIVGAGVAEIIVDDANVPRRHAVLVHRTLPGVAAPNAVKMVSQAGLLLEISGRDRAASWLTSGSVAAGLAARGDGEMFVLALDVDEGNASRLFTVAEDRKDLAGAYDDAAGRIAGNRPVRALEDCAGRQI